MNAQIALGIVLLVMVGSLIWVLVIELAPPKPYDSFDHHAPDTDATPPIIDGDGFEVRYPKYGKK
jgi:hypothetical protein